MALSFDNRYIVPIDVLKEIFAFIRFDQCFTCLRLVCKFWNRTVIEMMHATSNNRHLLLGWLQDLCMIWSERKKKRYKLLHNLESCYDLYTNYVNQSDVKALGRSCRCGLPMFFSKCKNCKFIVCICRLAKENVATCANIQCCFKQQFGLTFGFCLCKNDPCFSRYHKVQHLDNFFAHLKKSISV